MVKPACPVWDMLQPRTRQNCARQHPPLMLRVQPLGQADPVSGGDLFVLPSTPLGQVAKTH